MLERRAEEAAVALWVYGTYHGSRFSTDSGRIFSGLSAAKKEFQRLEAILGRSDFRISRAVRLEMDYWPTYQEEGEIGKVYSLGLSLYLGDVFCGEVKRLDVEGDWIMVSTTKTRMAINIPALETMLNVMEDILPQDTETLKAFEWAYPDTMTSGEDCPDWIIDEAFSS